MFPIAYAFFVSSLVASLAIRSLEAPSPGLMALLTLPLIAGLFDWIENALFLSLLKDTSSFSERLILLASVVASIKWFLILVPALAIVYHSVRRVAALVRRAAVDGR